MPPETCLMTIGRRISSFRRDPARRRLFRLERRRSRQPARPSAAPQSLVTKRDRRRRRAPSCPRRAPTASGATGSAGPIGVPAVDDRAGRRRRGRASRSDARSGRRSCRRRPMTFPDGSLGCPEPGMAYTQMVVDGFKIVVEANGRHVRLSRDRERLPSLLEDAVLTVPGPGALSRASRPARGPRPPTRRTRSAPRASA